MNTSAEPRIVRLTFPFAGVARCEVQFYERHIYLSKLLVEIQGRGIGSRVLAELKKYRQPIELVAYPDDVDRYIDLVRFYERNGFVMQEGQDLMVWTP